MAGCSIEEIWVASVELVCYFFSFLPPPMHLSRRMSCFIDDDLHHWLSCDQTNLPCGWLAPFDNHEHYKRSHSSPTRQTEFFVIYHFMCARGFQQQGSPWKMVASRTTSCVHAHEVQCWRWYQVHLCINDKSNEQGPTSNKLAAKQIRNSRWTERRQCIPTFLSNSEAEAFFLGDFKCMHGPINTL